MFKLESIELDLGFSQSCVCTEWGKVLQMPLPCLDISWEINVFEETPVCRRNLFSKLLLRKVERAQNFVLASAHCRHGPRLHSTHFVSRVGHSRQMPAASDVLFGFSFHLVLVEWYAHHSSPH